jgi:hypothetical protein
MAEVFRIAGVKIKTPSEVKIGRFDITKAERNAAGKMVMDIIATKRRVDCTWALIADSDLQTILNAITANKPFFALEYPEVGGQNTMICYSGDINTGLWHTKNGVRYWQDVSIPFIEQ